MNTPHTHTTAQTQQAAHTGEVSSNFEERMAWLDTALASTLPSKWPLSTLCKDLHSAEQALQQAQRRYWQHASNSLKTATQKLKATQAFTPKEVLFNALGVISDDDMWASLQARQDQAQNDIAQDETTTEQLQARIAQWEARLEKLQSIQAAWAHTTH